MFPLSMFPRGPRRLTTIAKTVNVNSAYKNGFNGYNRTYITKAERVHRVTMFKMPQVEDQQRFLEQCRKMAVDNQRGGKPYILSLAAGPAEDGPRTQGYTFVSKTEFASLDDMKFYENECPAHGAVKSVLNEITVDEIMTVFFKPQATGGSQQ